MPERRAMIALVAVQFLYLGLIAMNGRFLAGDEIPYKAPGREWARSGVWHAPELAGYKDWTDPSDPHGVHNLFSPPLYTFGFGVWTRVVGFNATASALYDAVIHVGLTWAIWCAARALGAPPSHALVAAVLSLAVGTAGRPDELAAAFGMAGWAVVVRSSSPKMMLVAGLLYGLAGATSFAGAALTVVPAIVAIALQQQRVRNLAIVGFTSLAVAVAALAPLAIGDPSSPGRTLRMARSAVETSFAYAIGNTMRYGSRFVFLIAAAALICLVHFAVRRRLAEWSRAWLGSWIAAIAVVAFVPAKYYYFWIVAAGMTAASAAAIASLPSRRFRIAIGAIGIAAFLPAMARFGLNQAVLMTLPAEQRLAPNVARIRQLIPRDAGIITYDFWPALANDYRVYSTEANPDWKSVDYIVLTGNGSGMAGKPQELRPELKAYVDEHFVAVRDDLNRQPFSLGPLKTNSAWGYGPLILKRR